MTHPYGMVTRNVTLPAFFTPGGAPVKGKAFVTAARAFIWEATGDTFLPAPVEVALSTVPVSITLPTVDQPGFVDGSGNAITGWTYTAFFRLSGGQEAAPITFLLTAGAGDLELVPDVSDQISGGTVNVPVPVQGLPGDDGAPGAPGVGVPAGGTTGQVLAKTSAADFATAWQTIAGSPDATTLIKGLIKLAGDLGGTADAPTVPGLAGKAPLASPTFTGTPAAPTAAPGTNTTQLANTAFVQAAVAALIAAAPGALDTLDELAAAMGDDANFATTVTNALALKAPLASPAFTGTPTGITKSHVGLANVDNTSDANKPVSTAQAAADTAVANASIAKALVDAKGDLVTATANDTPARLAVGADGLFLKANSAQPSGLEWAAPAGGGGGGLPEFKGITGGNALTRFNVPPVTTVGGQALSNTMLVAPMPIAEACQLRSISIGISAAGEAGCLIKLWLFSADGTIGSMPNILLADLGSLPGDVINSTTATYTPATPIALQPGHYMALIGDTAVTTHPSITGTGTTWAHGPTYRTRNQFRMDFGTRGGTSAAGVLATGSAPASIAWNFSATNPNTIDFSGGRIPLMLLDLIPA